MGQKSGSIGVWNMKRQTNYIQKNSVLSPICCLPYVGQSRVNAHQGVVTDAIPDQANKLIRVQPEYLKVQRTYRYDWARRPTHNNLPILTRVSPRLQVPTNKLSSEFPNQAQSEHTKFRPP